MADYIHMLNTDDYNDYLMKNNCQNPYDYRKSPNGPHSHNPDDYKSHLLTHKVTIQMTTGVTY